MKPVLLQPAYVLHRRAYRETSFIVELVTLEYGRISAVAKGARNKRSGMQGLLQSFIPLSISWSGQGEMVTLSHVELQHEIRSLKGDGLFAGFYVNELLMRLLQKWDPHPVLYALYEKTLAALQTLPLNQPALRSFEKKLLDELGYGVLSLSDKTAPAFLPEKNYRFVPEHGFVATDLHEQSGRGIFSGKSLHDFAVEKWADEQSLRDAKRLIRLLLAPLLGNKLLQSRQLFTQVIE